MAWSPVVGLNVRLCEDSTEAATAVYTPLVTIGVVTLVTRPWNYGAAMVPAFRYDGAMRENRPCWVCELDGCGGAWMATGEVPPEKCSKCKRRGWHKTKTVRELLQDAAPLATDGTPLHKRIVEIVREVLEDAQDVEPATYSEPVHAGPFSSPLPFTAKPTMESLREICAGKLQPSPMVESGSPMVEPSSACLYTEYDYESGETYACGLQAHTPKVKHTRGRRL